MVLGFLELSLWECLLIAFGPPAVIAIIGVRLSRRIDRSNDNLMTSVGRLAGAALVFICAFLTGSVWTQTLSYVEGWRVEYHAARELQKTADLLAGPKGVPVEDAAEGYLNAIRDTEINVDPQPGDAWQGSEQATAALLQAAVKTYALAETLPKPEATELTSSFDRLARAREKRFELGVQPGVRPLLLITVMLLAWIATLSLSLYPAAGQAKVKVFQATAVVIIVGLVQLPVYYLGAAQPLHEFVAGLFAQ